LYLNRRGSAEMLFSKTTSEPEPCKRKHIFNPLDLWIINNIVQIFFRISVTNNKMNFGMGWNKIYLSVLKNGRVSEGDLR
jgi:hypothetical protein